MLSDRCSVLSACNVRALWTNGWTDQDKTWHAGRPRPWPHCVRWGPSSPSSKGAQPPTQFLAHIAEYNYNVNDVIVFHESYALWQ